MHLSQFRSMCLREREREREREIGRERERDREKQKGADKLVLASSPSQMCLHSALAVCINGKDDHFEAQKRNEVCYDPLTRTTLSSSCISPGGQRTLVDLSFSNHF